MADTTTTLDIGSLVWERQRHSDHQPAGGYVVDEIKRYSTGYLVEVPNLVLLTTDATGPIVEWRWRGHSGHRTHGIPTVRLIEVPTASIEPLTVSPPSLPQMHKVARQALATVGIGRGALSDTERELLGYAATLMETE